MNAVQTPNTHRGTGGPRKPCPPGGQIVFGSVLLAAGAVLLAERMGYVDIDQPWRLWPLILVAIGLGRLVDRSEDGVRTAFWLFSIAAIWLLHNFWVVRINHSWPLFIVVAGISVIWKALTARHSTETSS